MSIETLTSFFGWMVVLNFGFLIVAGILLIAMRDWAAHLHARMFHLEEHEVRKAYFDYLARYKILTFVFVLMPYIALKLV